MAVKLSLFALLCAAIALIAVLLSKWPPEKEALATVTALLAVVVAILSIWPSLRVLELQEDVLKPNPLPFFDLTSRYQLLQLRVKNTGGSVAYDVRLEWDKHPQNEEGHDVAALDFIPTLVPQESVSTDLGRSFALLKKFQSMTFSGHVTFKDGAGRKSSQKFSLSADAHRHRLLHDDELPKTLYELQKIPDILEKIADSLGGR